jgi:hypothetical protein
MNCAESQLVSFSPEVSISVLAQTQMFVYNPFGPPDYWTYNVTLGGNETKQIKNRWSDWSRGELLCDSIFYQRVDVLTAQNLSWFLRGNLPGTLWNCAGRAGMKGVIEQTVQEDAFAASYEATNGGPELPDTLHSCTVLWDTFLTNEQKVAGVSWCPLDPDEPGYPGERPCPQGLLPIGGFYSAPFIFNGEILYWYNKWTPAPSAQFGFRCMRGDTGQQNIYERGNRESALGYNGTLSIMGLFEGGFPFTAKLYDGEVVTTDWGSITFNGLQPQ